MTDRQQRRYVTIQTGLIGAIAGIMSVPLGLLLAWVLIFVINRRSFGWTLQFESNPEILLQAIGVSIGAAILAGAASMVLGRKKR
jgi:putative ABC transport system permease protein